ESRKPNHCSVPIKIISASKILLIAQMIIPGLFARQLVQVSYDRIKANIKAPVFCFNEIETFAGSQFTRNHICICPTWLKSDSIFSNIIVDIILFRLNLCIAMLKKQNKKHTEATCHQRQS